MKLIQKGMTPSNWENQYVCTGWGKRSGCGAVLLVNHNDLFGTYQFPSDRDGDRGLLHITFKCSECGVLTNINDPVPKSELLPSQEVWEARQPKSTSILHG